MIAAAFELGALAQVATVAGIVALVWLLHRGGGGAALSTLSEANRILERRVGELEKTNREQEGELADLRARTDHVAALAPLMQELRDHDQRRADQSERVLDVLGLIAARLGPDNGGGGE